MIIDNLSEKAIYFLNYQLSIIHFPLFPVLIRHGRFLLQINVGRVFGDGDDAQVSGSTFDAGGKNVSCAAQNLPKAVEAEGISSGAPRRAVRAGQIDKRAVDSSARQAGYSAADGNFARRRADLRFKRADVGAVGGVRDILKIGRTHQSALINRLRGIAFVNRRADRRRKLQAVRRCQPAVRRQQ